ncbi:30S ribosomal protein S8 [Candidatus Woesearchaeota archaeon]|nr:30S ribosomal protein S8 [Candidatus Woesearchaeota archaeon]
MTLNDPLSNALSKINNAQKVGKLTCTIYPSSKIIMEILNILKKAGYILDYKENKTSKGNILDVTLANKINNCKVIKPRYQVKLQDIEKFEKRFLPAKGFGILIISTPKGILTHHEVKEKNIGGRLIAYCY